MEKKNSIQEFIKNEKERKPLKIIRFKDVLLDYDAVIVIDSLLNGKSSGGIRISEFIDTDEIILMAKSMTLKYAILQRMMGGAKCGIHIPSNCTDEQKTQILKSFGKQASSILQSKTYIPYMDMNCSQKDINTILTAANCPLYQVSDSSFFTALSVVYAIKSTYSYENRSSARRPRRPWRSRPRRPRP